MSPACILSALHTHTYIYISKYLIHKLTQIVFLLPKHTSRQEKVTMLIIILMRTPPILTMNPHHSGSHHHYLLLVSPVRAVSPPLQNFAA